MIFRRSFITKYQCRVLLDCVSKQVKHLAIYQLQVDKVRLTAESEFVRLMFLALAL